MMSENSACCGCTEGEPMEDMPMCRYSNPIPTCEHKRGCGSRGGHCPCEEQLEQILAALACQNQLLVDLLGAVNCLTAALLAEHTNMST